MHERKRSRSSAELLQDEKEALEMKVLVENERNFM